MGKTSIDEIIRRALEFHGQGRLAQAEPLYRQALQSAPDHPDSLHLLGVLCGQMRRFDEAEALIGRAIALYPGVAILYNSLGNVLADRGQPDKSVPCYRKAVELQPDYAEAYYNLGNAWARQGQLAEAVDSFRKAVKLRPNYVEAHNRLGFLLDGQGKTAEAVECYRRALQLKPDFAEAHNNLGNALRDQRQIAQAADCYRRAVQLQPAYAEAHGNLGNSLGEQGQFAQAVGCYRKALELKFEHPDIYSGLGNALKELGQFAEAADCYRQALRRKPDHLAVQGQLAALLQQMCQWEGLLELSVQAQAAVQTNAPGNTAHAMPPFLFITLSTPPATAEQQLQCASRWAREQSKFAQGACDADKMSATHEGETPSPHGPARPVEARAKITLGYFSADVREHPVARLIVELFEKHDRKRFSVLGYSYGPDDGSALRRRISGAFDRFADVRDLSDVQIAQRIADDGVDILIDLTGYTQHARPQVLAMRPAPIQVNYLGYPGTMGATFIDYILVDDFIAPPSRQPFFTEKLVQLPGCYQANDGKREIALRTPTRAQCGLPESGFVFCAFHNSYKISPEMFDVWMRLLKEVPGSVLWLLEDNRFAPDNLRREAQARGVAAERLVFAPRRPLPEHLARHRLADVYLDEYPVNAHTTTSDALWVGCPVLTRSGDTFISRVAGSLLTTIGLPDLVTTSLEEYERQALRLARDADYLADVRARIEANRDRCGLFDASHFAVGIEKAYSTMWEIHAAGESPRAFAVSKS